jgi:hypothetical protein
MLDSSTADFNAPNELANGIACAGMATSTAAAIAAISQNLPELHSHNQFLHLTFVSWFKESAKFAPPTHSEN